MSKNKQSSVDILCQKLANKLGLQAITFYIDHQEEIAEAKAMHQEEMVDFAMKFMMQDRPIISFYNETFGGNNESNI